MNNSACFKDNLLPFW